MRGYFVRSVGSVLLLMLVLVAAMIAGAPYIPGSQVILYTTFEQSFVFHVLDPYRRLSFEVARDLDFNFLYAPAPDGERIFVRKSEMDDGFMTEREGILNLYTGEFTNADTLEFFSYATWTADGRVLVFGGNRIQYLDPATRTLELLHQTEVNDAPVAAPNGCCIAYTTFDGVYIYEIATGNVITLDSDTVDDAFFSPRFSPDSRKLAYVKRSNDANNNGLFIFDFTTGETQQIAISPMLMVNHPTWSPDGRKIAFVRGANQSDIYIIDVETGEIEQITDSAESEANLMWVK